MVIIYIIHTAYINIVIITFFKTIIQLKLGLVVALRLHEFQHFHTVFFVLSLVKFSVINTHDANECKSGRCIVDDCEHSSCLSGAEMVDKGGKSDRKENG